MLRDDLGSNYHPILEMARLACDPKSSPELQGRMHSEVAQYIVPKLRTVEVTGEDGGPVKMQFSWGAAHD